MQNKKPVKNLAQIHPGEILLDEFLIPLRISQVKLSKEACINIEDLNELLRGNSHITDEIADKLAEFFRTTPQFWLGLQSNYDSELLK